MYCNLSGLLRIARPFVVALCVAGIGGVCLAGAEITLYDVDFDGPPHVVNLTPAFGAGPYPRITPTSGGQIFSPTGSATVLASFGPLANQPVKIKAIDDTPMDPTHLGGAYLSFDLSDPQLAWINRFHASVDVLPSNLRTASGLGIFFDASTIHSVQFMPDGNIRVIDATGVDQLIGQYSPQTMYHVQMTFDKAAVEWSAAINGIPIYHGPTDEIDMETFRIAMTTGDTLTPSVAYVDNIRITADAPEPGTICLAAMAVSAGMAIFTRRRKRHG
jgi:hypothetical protein